MTTSTPQSDRTKPHRVHALRSFADIVALNAHLRGTLSHLSHR